MSRMPKISQDFFRSLILILLVGGAAGVLGAVAAWSAFLAYRTELVIGNTTRPLVTMRSKEEISETKIREQLAAVLASIWVDFWSRPSGRGRPLGDYYLPREGVGQGFVLTSDGWLLTVKGMLPADHSSLVAGLGAGLVRPTRFLLDRETEVVFLKVSAANLKAAEFGDSTRVSAGEVLYLPISPVEFRKVEVRRQDELLTSSDELTARWVFSPALDQDVLGSPLLDSRGEVMAIVTAVDQAVPIDQVKPLLRGLLVEGKLLRPALGARGTLLAGARLASGGRQRGFLIASERGLKRGSAAEKADLEAGDVILKIDETLVNGGLSLAELLLAWRPGDKVDLRIAREGEEKLLTIILGERNSGQEL